MTYINNCFRQNLQRLQINLAVSLAWTLKVQQAAISPLMYDRLFCIGEQRLNNYMKEKHPLHSIYAELLSLRIIENQTDFSVMCGRTPAWFSTLKARRLLITTDAALTLAFKLRRKARTSICPSTHDSLMAISEQLLEVAEKQVAKKVAFRETWAGKNESLWIWTATHHWPETRQKPEATSPSYTDTAGTASFTEAARESQRYSSPARKTPK